MSEELEVLKLVTERLDQAKITYLISGSIAANYYTIPRMTRDIDIVIEMKTGDVGRFINLFKDNFSIDEDMVKTEVQKGGMFNLIHNKYIIKIDFILRKASAWQESMFLRRKKIDIDHSSAWLISGEDLILAKLLWAKDSMSEMQLKDVAHLLKSIEILDRGYLSQWIKRAWFGEGLPKGIIMLDTHESIQLRFEKMMMERSPIERLKMGCSMFDTAKEIVRSSILNKNPQASLEEIRKGIFLRFYGQDFNEVQIKNILGGLKP